MPYKYNPLEDDFDTIGKIPQYDTDPASPQPEDAWILKSSTGSGISQFGLLPIMLSGNTGGSATYKLKYRTKELTTISVNLT